MLHELVKFNFPINISGHFDWISLGKSNIIKLIHILQLFCCLKGRPDPVQSRRDCTYVCHSLWLHFDSQIYERWNLINTNQAKCSITTSRHIWLVFRYFFLKKAHFRYKIKNVLFFRLRSFVKILQKHQNLDIKTK